VARVKAKVTAASLEIAEGKGGMEKKYPKMKGYL
jgi:hypothetical protein